jgi:hypothetical protein
LFRRSEEWPIVGVGLEVVVVVPSVDVIIGFEGGHIDPGLL